MKSIRHHIMFILPLVAILLGIEAFLVFGRVTASYGENLKHAYTILVVTRKPMPPEAFQKIDPHIDRVEAIDRAPIVQQIAEGLSNTSEEDVLKSLPYFYTVRLNRYLSNTEVDRIRQHLIDHPDIRRVETFGQVHNANYNLFMLIRASLWTFVGFMIFTSLFLVVKQMEIWQLEHRERMQVMEILGASGMQRSGVLFRIALTDALIATLVTIGVFVFLRYSWVVRSGIDLLVSKQNLFFQFRDIFILLGIALVIVLVSVVLVSRNVEEVRDA